MDWSNERYVRLYTRDTTTWKLLTWEARFVMMSLLRKVDRSGVLEVGEDGIDGLAAVIEVPLEIVERGLPHLIKRGTVDKTERAYVMPNFLDAQEAVSSTAQRKRDQRERRRDESRNVTVESRNVTNGHETGHMVTRGHAESQMVTPSLAVPSQTKPDREVATRKRGRAPTQKHRLPDGWVPNRSEANIEAEELAKARGVNLRSELLKLRDWAISTAATKSDWDAAWRNWTRRADARSSKQSVVTLKQTAPEWSDDIGAHTPDMPTEFKLQ